jgi:hypothetical protein
VLWVNKKHKKGEPLAKLTLKIFSRMLISWVARALVDMCAGAGQCHSVPGLSLSAVADSFPKDPSRSSF